MEHSKLTCCYFPTTVAFIDDHETFLENTISQLQPNFIYAPFVKVSTFKEFLVKHPSQLQNKQWMQANDDVPSTDSNRHDISVNLHLLHEQIYSFDRYKEISVAVVDYAMPECTGIELCQVIRNSNPNIRILLLTGEADHQIAVDAFNKKLIDKFILKEEENKTFTAKLDNIIFELSQDYFAETFASLGMNVTANNPLLKDPDFIKLFNRTYKVDEDCEYYLIDSSSSFLMLNDLGYATWLIVKSEEDYQTYCELAGSEENIDANTLELIKQKARIPFYHGEYLNLPPANHWNDHLLKSDPLTINKVQYPYTVWATLEHSIIERSKVYSFDKYKQMIKRGMERKAKQ